MANLENKILDILKEKEDWKKYREYIPVDSLTPVTRRLLECIDDYWNKYYTDTSFTWEEFKSWVNSIYSSDTHIEAIKYICDINNSITNTDTARDILNSAVERDISQQIEGLVEDGSVDVVQISSLLSELDKFKNKDLDSVNNLVSTDLEEVLKDSHVSDEGFEFSLECLQQSIGPLRAGNTIYIPARPEVGKTTFLMHQTGHMITNTENTSALILSNEEDGNRLMLRLIQSVIGWTTKDILADPKTAKAEYETRIGDRDRIRIIHAAVLERRECERAIETYEPNLLVFNMLSKVKGFGNRYSQDVDVFEALGAWMRELANSYGCPAMTAWQAGGDAEGLSWVEQHHMYKSKTGVVGEADVILGIGKSGDATVPENYRFLHPSKNKLPGDSKTIETMRHGYFNDVFIDTSKGRFYE